LLVLGKIEHYRTHSLLHIILQYQRLLIK
jgi:hypothetical protein